MALLLCLFLVANIHVSLSQQNMSMEGVLEQLKPLVRIPDMVRAYPDMPEEYTEVVELLMRIIWQYVSVKGMDRAKIPDVQQELKVTVKGMSYRTTFTGQQGWIEKMSTLVRVGDVIATRYGPGLVSVSTSLSLRSLVVGFDKYTLPIGFIARLAGNMNINIGKNRVLVKVLIAVEDETDSCSFFLEHIEVEELGDFKATTTGLKPFNWFVGIIIDAILSNFQGALRTDLESKMKIEARKLIKQIPCGNF